MTIELKSVDVAAVEPWIEPMVDLYTTVYDTGDPFDHPDRYREQLAGHMKAPGWKAVLACEQDELIGYIYGFALRSGTAWWDGLTTPVPEDFTEEDGTRTAAISELMVAKALRNRGIAKMLHDTFLADREEQRATLLVEQDNPAVSIYAGWGWEKAAEVRPGWEHAPLFDVLILEELPQRDRRHDPA